MGRFLNFNLFTPLNMFAIGAIIFFWGALAYFAKETISGETVATEAAE